MLNLSILYADAITPPEIFKSNLFFKDFFTHRYTYFINIIFKSRGSLERTLQEPKLVSPLGLFLQLNLVNWKECKLQLLKVSSFF